MNARDPNAVIPPAERDLAQMLVTEPVAGVPHVYAAMLDVQREIGKTGIAKLHRNKDQGFNFRGIDDLYNELCQIMVKANLICVPRFVEHKQTEGKTSTGKPMRLTTVTAEYTFTSAKDGSSTVARTFGEGFDTSDKSTNKSMSAAHKYCLIQAFCIPIVGSDDGDADDIKIGDPNKAETTKGGGAKGAEAKGSEKKGTDNAGKPNLIPEPTGVDPAVTVAAMAKAIKEAGTEDRLRAAFAKYQDSIKAWKTFSPKQRKTWLDEITAAKDQRKKEIATTAQQNGATTTGEPKS